MSFQRGPSDTSGFPPPQNRSPFRDSWSSGRFSPAILVVAVIVIAILIGAAFLSRRNAPGTATATVGGQPVAAPSSTPPAATSAPPQASAAPSSAAPAASAAPSARTPTVAPRTFVVGNTDGDGVYLRRTPSLADRDTAYVDGTKLVAIGDDVTAEGELWHHVRAPDGKTGYVPAKYTIEAPN